MKIAVNDACIFIDIIELNLTGQFFKLDIEVHTSVDVFNELHDDHRAILNAYQTVGILFIHNISPAEKRQILNEDFPKALSCMDKTVLFLAKKLGAYILSSDQPVRKYSKSNAIEYHGMLWVFERLIDAKRVTPSEAIKLINALVSKNMIYINSRELSLEVNKRIKQWMAMI